MISAIILIKNLRKRSQVTKNSNYFDIVRLVKSDGEIYWEYTTKMFIDDAKNFPVLFVKKQKVCWTANYTDKYKCIPTVRFGEKILDFYPKQLEWIFKKE